MRRTQHGDIADQRRFAGIIAGNQQRPPGVAAGQGGWQHAANAPQFAAQGEFAEELVLPQTFAVDLSRRGQDTQRDRQIESATLFGQVGWRQIDGDTATGELELTVQDRAAHAILAFLDRRLRQPDDEQPR